MISCYLYIWKEAVIVPACFDHSLVETRHSD